MSITSNEAKTTTSRAFRRVVTGHDATGKAVVVADGPSEDVAVVSAIGLTIADMWQMSGVPTRIDAWERRDPEQGMDIRKAGGLTFRVLRLEPSPSVDEIADAMAAFQDMTGSTDDHVEHSRHPMMHRTETVDFAIVLSGSVTLLLDEDDVELSAGDVVIQRGTNHTWENRGDEPCVMAVVAVDAAA
jgi:hypothetical protein